MPGIGITGGRFGGGGGGSASITVGVFSDAGATIPITSVDWGVTIYIKATATATQENFTLFIDNGLESLLPVVAIDSSATHIFEYTAHLVGTLDIYVIASDNTNGIADSEPFEFTVSGVYPPYIAGNSLWVDGTLESAYVLNGAFVQQLIDLSGLSNHLSAPTVGNQPLYLDIPNGINSLRSTQFASGKFLNKLGFSLDIVTGNSVYIVAQFTTNITGGFISNGNTVTDGTPYFSIQQSGLGVRTYSASVGYSATYPIALNTTYLLEVHRTTSVERFYINGVLQHTRAMGITGNRGNLYLNTGYANQIAAKTGDIAIFNTIISPTNETDLRNFLMTKWNIV
jgi:hypothetical protein